MNIQMSAGVDEDDNDNNDGTDGGYQTGDDGNLDEQATDYSSNSGTPSDTDGSGDSDDNYANTAGKYADQTDQHRNALGSVIQNLQDRGIDVDSVAQEAGLSTSDVDNMSDDDLSALSSYVAQNHPEITQQVFSRFPAAQSFLSRFLG